MVQVGRHLGGAVAMLLLLTLLGHACGRTPPPHEPEIAVRFSDLRPDPAAAAKLAPLLSPAHTPKVTALSPEQMVLFTYLQQTPAAKLARTPPHARAIWRIEKIYLLDDCVAVQLTEGHYLETLFFVQCPTGWRLAARITPEAHRD